MSGHQVHLEQAIGASLAWYADIHAMHGISTIVQDDMWQSTGQALPWHSAVKTLTPTVGGAEVAAAVGDRVECTVADSYGTLDLTPYGFTLLFEAQWLRLPGAAESVAAHLPAHWAVVRSTAELVTWSDRHDYVGVLGPEALQHPRLTVLARYDGTEMTGGAVLNEGGATVGLSNVWFSDGQVADVAGALSSARQLHPGRDLTTYAEGDDLANLTRVGFMPVGPHRVWVRNRTCV